MENKNSFLVENNRKTALDTLANMLCATGKTLDTKIETIIEEKFYCADNEYYLLGTIEEEKLEQLEKYKDYKIYVDGWSEMSLEQFFNLDIHHKQNITIVY